MASLFSDFLTCLGIRHTEDYSDSRFSQMPFQSMFGMAELLKEYGIGSVGVSVAPEAREHALANFKPPFLIDTAHGFAIISEIANGDATYMTQHKVFTAPVAEIIGGWNGIALLAEADSESIEPEYSRHHIAEMSKSVKRCILIALAAALAGFAMWASGLYSSVAGWMLLALDCAGIMLSWMLVQKSLGIRNDAAEAVCSAIEEGGCDEIAQSEASSFMGIFKWSEVGLAYFSVSLLAMLLFPRALPALAAINILCLPYTVWSITYQKFKAKVWCTLCVCVQATLWLLFAAYLIGGYTRLIFPLTTEFIVNFLALGCCYVAVMLGLNSLDDALAKLLKPRQYENA